MDGTATTLQSCRQAFPWRRIGSLASTVATVVFVAAVCTVVVGALASRLSSNQEFTLFGHPALAVLSGSMTPVIDTGDFIVDSPARGATDLRVGQIISFYDSPGSRIVLTHRIIQVIHHGAATFYRTKGDANQAADPELRPSQDVIGVFSFRVPRGGFFLANIHRPLVLGMLLAAPMFWLLASALRSWAGQDDPT